MPVPDYSVLEQEQQARVAGVRKSRDGEVVARALEAVKVAAAGTTPMMEPVIAAVRARATLGEIADTLATAWGMYRPAR